ncbi:lytic murein transglycosylase [Ovoidimarina sediminis]|uniref:lytic murein transglycosylase n=1 Tax=Ovoidimarina sediminis TaxID=3079856 RepID=UPI002906320E|nr:lytic murein transglycosylase [Rhodophyticola sp. MJ-SS7]MDU8945504.1 lytic murein transglycosylase [Rhodophyticola sp. MJ-SS7]
MKINRRNFSAGLAVFGIAGCSGADPFSVEEVGLASDLPPDLRPTPNARYEEWVADFRARAVRQGYSESLVSSAFRGTGYLPGVVERDRNQIEFRRSLEDYLSITVSDERVTKGRASYARNRTRLKAIERASGVNAYIVAAIWGIESFFGERRGEVPVVSATSTLAYDGRRGRFFKRQLFAALEILRMSEVAPGDLRGSWAGAMGHTQFIPTSYLFYAVDFDGDSRRDVWSDDPTDALASAANYLSRNGWQSGLRWGGEVGSDAPSGSVIQPQAGGPRFSTTSNFRAIKRYNNSDAYAIAVGHLADRIAGAPPLRGSFPPDANGMTKDDRIALQRQLTARGFDTGGIDGVIGPTTRDAIGEYQARMGLPVTGDPSMDLLRRLK